MKKKKLRMRGSIRQGLVAIGIGGLSCAAMYASDSLSIDSDMPATLSKSVVISHADQNKLINVVLVLRMNDPEGAANYALHVSTRLHPLYGQYLTPEEFGDKFGPAKADYETLIAWAKSNGLKINEENRGRTTLSVGGTVGQFERLFQTQINNYRGPDGREFFSASIAPSAPQEFAGRVQSAVGLSSYNRFAPLAMVCRKLSDVGAQSGVQTDTAGGTGPGGAFSPADLRTAYMIPSHLSIPSKTETVAVFEQGGFFQSDVDAFLKQNHLPSVPVTVRGVNGFGGGVNDAGVELEAVLDIDAAIGFNPALKQIQVYEDGDDPFAVALLDSLVAMANDRTAQVISISYGLDEVQQGTAQVQAEAPLFQQLAAQGQAVFVSSGDQGAYGRTGNNSYPATYNAPDPGSQPFVTSVGGTALSTGPNQEYEMEEAWNNLSLAGGGATGGGVSSIWTIPSWQFDRKGVSVAKANGGSSTMRNVPDVAAVGSPYTGFAVYSAINGGWIQIGGTSLSAPLWASFASVLDSAQRALGLGQLGFFNPTLYRLGPNAAAIHDIGDGSNGNISRFGNPGYYAGSYYDNCTGWGSIGGSNFTFYYLSTPSAVGKKPAMPRGVHGTSTRTSITVEWTPVANANGYIAIFGLRTTVGVDVTRGTKAVLTGLTPNTTYQVFVSALNKAGASPYYNDGIFVTTSN